MGDGLGLDAGGHLPTRDDRGHRQGWPGDPAGGGECSTQRGNRSHLAYRRKREAPVSVGTLCFYTRGLQGSKSVIFKSSLRNPVNGETMESP